MRSSTRLPAACTGCRSPVARARAGVLVVQADRDIDRILTGEGEEDRMSPARLRHSSSPNARLPSYVDSNASGASWSAASRVARSSFQSSGPIRRISITRQSSRAASKALSTARTTGRADALDRVTALIRRRNAGARSGLMSTSATSPATASRGRTLTP